MIMLHSIDKCVVICYYVIVMKNIQNKLEQAIYGYEPSEFLPIRVDGQVSNWDQFAIYKAKRLFRKATSVIS